jgi:hypothetical protein
LIRPITRTRGLREGALVLFTQFVFGDWYPGERQGAFVSFGKGLKKCKGWEPKDSRECNKLMDLILIGHMLSSEKPRPATNRYTAIQLEQKDWRTSFNPTDHQDQGA